MRLDPEKVRKLCRERRIQLKDLLQDAGVSRTAYYSLVRKESVLPKSLCRVAARLGVSAARFLDDDAAKTLRIRELQSRAEVICRRYPDVDRDVVLRTLMNLELPPVERLRKALNRAPKTHLRR